MSERSRVVPADGKEACCSAGKPPVDIFDGTVLYTAQDCSVLVLMAAKPDPVVTEVETAGQPTVLLSTWKPSKLPGGSPATSSR